VVGGGDEFGDAVGGEVGGPAGVVDEVVVPAAEQDSVGEVGVAVECPGVQVVGFAPGGWPVPWTTGDCSARSGPRHARRGEGVVEDDAGLT